VTDLNALDDYLSSDESPENCMMLSDLDGFLTGVICSPDLIPPSQWLPVALGGQLIDIPPNIIDLIMQRYNEIVGALNHQPPMLEPVFWQAKEGHVIAMDWCEGFIDALHLRTKSWDELLRTEDGRNWMFPIFAHLVDKDGRSLVGATEEQMDALLDTAAEMIPATVPNIFRFWQSRWKGATELH
jgi:uncharacterized protein